MTSSIKEQSNLQRRKHHMVFAPFCIWRNFD